MFKRGGGGKARFDKVRLDDRVKRVSEAEDRKRASAPIGPPISERRAAGGARQSTYVPGFLVLPDGSSAEIVISNISDAGAELRSPRFFHHNKPFTLAAPTLGLKRRARVVWNTGNTFGVAFVD